MKLKKLISVITLALAYVGGSQSAWAESDLLWALALSNPGEGGYYRAYTSKSACDKYKDGGGRCELVIPSCGSQGIPVFTTMWVIEQIADYKLGNTIVTYTMNGEDVGDAICHGEF